MQVKPGTGVGAYASATIATMISDAGEPGLKNHVVRFGAEWAGLGKAAGARRRAAIIRQLVRWYLRYPGVKLPERPPRPPDVS